MGGTDEFRCSEWRIAMPSDLSPTSAIVLAEEEKGRHLYLRDFCLAVHIYIRPIGALMETIIFAESVSFI